MNERVSGTQVLPEKTEFIESAERAEAALPRNPFFDLYRIWHGWPRSEGGVPDRSHMDPIDLKSFLPNLIFVERLADGDFYYRVAGGHIVSSAEFEPTGKRISEFPSFVLTNPIIEALSSVLDQSMPRYDVLSGLIFDKQWKTYRRLLLPLSGSDGTPTYILGCIVATEGQGEYGLA